jgi:O-antigen/teichoic acid export membrane protein
MMWFLGGVAAVLVAALAPWLSRSVLNVPEHLQGEALGSFLVLAGTLPFVVSTAGQVGILQAYQKFGWINAVRLPQGVFNFLGPVLVLLVTPSLVATTVVLATSRLAAWVVFRHMCRARLGGGPSGGFSRPHFRELLGFGGWITVSNVIGPMMLYFDRFLIGVMLTLTAVAHYTTPYEVVTRLWFLPEALVGVLFPALATSLVADPERAARIFGVSARVMLLSIFPLVALIMLFAPEGLLFWLGEDFARHSTSVMRWLAIGVFVNCLARLPSATLQSSGRPDLNAKIHMLELVPSLLLLWGLIHIYGVVGAAVAWTLRIAVDTLALFWFSMKVTPHMRALQIRTILQMLGGAILLGALLLLQPLWVKMGVAVLIICVCAGVILRDLRRLASTDGAILAKPFK